jgi:sulfatase maturation enzyme AslB (radical SAM superfamily)/Flp pilus assembly protein TadD
MNRPSPPAIGPRGGNAGDPAQVRACEAGRSSDPLRVALFNDTGRFHHVGCRGVTLGHDRMFARHGIEVRHRSFLGEWCELWRGDPAASLEAFLASALPERLREVDAVVVNGEGTIHHGHGLHLLTILAGARQLGLPAFLVNAVFQESEHFPETLRGLNDFTVRDAHSAAYLQSLGVPHRVVFDSILEADFAAEPAHDFSGKIVVTDWHGARDSDVGAALRGLMRDLGSECVYYPLEGPERERDWRHALADLRAARLVVTGRHHGVCLAGMAGVPFVALGSNTWKIQGLLALLPGGLRVCTEPARLLSRCNEAIASRARFAEIQHFLHTQRPLSTFDRLAALRSPQSTLLPSAMKTPARPSLPAPVEITAPGKVDPIIAPPSPALRRAPKAPASARIVVLDEASRHRELYGETFERLGVRPESGHNRTHEEVLASNPDLILLSREWSYDWRLIAAGARRAGIPVVYVMDGVLEWSYVWNNLSYVRGEGTVLQPLIASDLCVIGQHPARILAGLGLAPRLHITGLPRYDGFDRRRTLHAAARPRIVVTTARTWGHNVEHQVSVLRALRDLKAWFDDHPWADAVWRIAPDLADEIGVKPANSGPLSAALAEAAALVSFPSTCVLEGMLKGLPVAQIDYRPVPAYVATGWEIRSPEQIESVMQELLHPPPHRLAHQDACLRDELETGDASGRVAEVIRTALERPVAYPDQAAPYEILGRLDYRQVHSELSAFALSNRSILQYELDAAYGILKRIKRERDDLRRERDQLHQQCADLRAATEAKDRTVRHLDRLATERQQTIEQLDKLARERQQTIEHLDQLLRRGKPADSGDRAKLEALQQPLPPPPPPEGEAGGKWNRRQEAGSTQNPPAPLASALDPVGETFLAATQRDEARASHSTAQQLDKLLQSGRALMSQGKFAEACSAFEQAQELDPKNLEALLQGARCQIELEDLTAARLEYLRALKLAPDNAEAKQGLQTVEQLKAAPPPSATERLLKACAQAEPFRPTPEMLARAYPCPYAFSQLYMVPRSVLDLRFCSYHGPVFFEDQKAVYRGGVEALDRILHAHPQFVARRAAYLAGDYKGAGCSENCIWFNKWKTTGKGFKLADHLGPDGRFKLGKIWLSMGPDCNVTCRYCLEPGEFKMDFNTCDPAVMNIARDFVRRGGELLLTGGETFLPKWGFARALEELVNWGDAKGTISLHTNGTYLNEKNRDLLLRGPVSVVGVSMDTLRKDLYEYLRRGTSYDLVWGNVTSLLRERAARGQSHPVITILCAVMKSTAGHIVETVDRAVEAGLGISLNALFQGYYSPAFSSQEGLHNLSPAELDKLYADVLHLEKKYGPNGRVNWQGFKGQVENQLQLARSGKGEKQVILGGGGQTPRLPHFEQVARAEALAGEGRFEEAAREIEPVLPLLKRSIRGQRAWAAILTGLNRADEAAAAWRTVLQLDPRDFAAKETLEQLERTAAGAPAAEAVLVK